PKKMTDPTEAALSAIQEALNVQDDEDKAPGRPEGMSDLFEDTEQGRPQAPQTRRERVSADAVGTRDLAAQPPPAANADPQSIGRVLQALQRRPASASYFVAGVFSAAWVSGCVALSWAYLSDLNATLGPGHSPTAIMIGLGSALLLPIIFFFGVAHMAWRAQ